MSDCRSYARTVVAAMLGILCIVHASRDALAAIQAPGERRDHLTVEELAPDAWENFGLVHNANFMPVGPSADALHALSGVLEVPETQSHSVKGRFPAFSVEFFSHGGNLVPTKRGFISGGISLWNLVLSPGRVWSEPGDDGWSRASFPFTLTGKRRNDSHNGIASFLYNETEVSALRIQVVQEAAPWGELDGWAQVPLAYKPGPIANRRTLEERFARERAQHIPMRPWSALEGVSDPSLLADFDGYAYQVTVSGLVVDGVLYAQPCRTRFGDYPYCREMRHGVYSVTKSLGGALSLLRLAQKYGDAVFDFKIADYLDVTADHDGWDEVTFADALNMATGIGDKALNRGSESYDFHGDRGSMARRRFWYARSAKARLDAVFSAGNYSWNPGEVGSYNGGHTFTLAAAMDALLKRREGPDAHLWDMVAAEVLEPIGVLHAPMMHTREPDGGRGMPIMGWGYFPTVGEMATIAELLHAGGKHQGRQLLSATKLREVFPSPAAPGLPVNWHNDFGEFHYHMSFWYMPFRGKDGCLVWIPEMSGYGGNQVVLMPNGMTGIRLADGGASRQYDTEGMVRLADDLAPFCQ